MRWYVNSVLSYSKAYTLIEVFIWRWWYGYGLARVVEAAGMALYAENVDLAAGSTVGSYECQ